MVNENMFFNKKISQYPIYIVTKMTEMITNFNL